MAESNPTCSICLETYKDPITTPCNHVFCSGCLKRHEEKNSREGSFACPLCNREVKGARVGVSGVDKKATDQKDVSSEVLPKCDVCGPKILAASRCLECEENYCQGCAALHIKLKALRNHTLRELGVLDPEDKVTLRSPEFCQKHPEEEIKIVCKTCKNIPLCLLCKISEHDSHKSRLLAVEVGEIRSALERNLTLLSVRMEQHQIRTKECEAIGSKIDKSEAEEIMTAIKQEQDLIRLLAEQKLKLKEEAQTIREGIKKIYEKVQKENDDCKKRLAKEFSDCETFHSEARKLIDTAAGSAIMQIDRNLREKLLEENKRTGNIKLLGLKHKAFTPAGLKIQNVQLKMGAIAADIMGERKNYLFDLGQHTVKDFWA